MLKIKIGLTFFPVAVAVIAGPLESQSASPPPAQHVFFRVQLAASAPAPLSGRRLIFLKNGSRDKEVDVDEFHPGATAVAAREVHDLAPGQSLEVNADETSYPQPFSTMPPGDYEVQAALDVNHTYNYSGRGVQDWISGVVLLAHWTPAVGTMPSLTLDRHPPENPRRALVAKAIENAKPGVAQKEELVSPSLSQFWGRPVAIRAWVILPPDYASEARQRYPTVYWTHGFGGNLDYSLLSGMALATACSSVKCRP